MADDRTEETLHDVLWDHWPQAGEGEAVGHVVCTCGWSVEVQENTGHAAYAGHLMVQFVRLREDNPPKVCDLCGGTGVWLACDDEWCDTLSHVEPCPRGCKPEGASQ